MIINIIQCRIITINFHLLLMKPFIYMEKKEETKTSKVILLLVLVLIVLDDLDDMVYLVKKLKGKSKKKQKIVSYRMNEETNEKL